MFLDIRPDDTRIHYAGCVSKTLTPEAAWFDRHIVNSPYGYDSPGVTIEFITDADRVSVDLEYTDKESLPGHTSYSSAGICFVDSEISGIFTRTSDRGERLRIGLSVEPTRQMRHFEIVLPVADRVGFIGLTLHGATHFDPPDRERKPRYVAYGDSITQGFWASSSIDAYPYRLAWMMGWQAVNMGFGSRRATASDGRAIALQNPDIATILIGVNDCLGSVPLEEFRANYEGLLDSIRDTRSSIPIFAITPLCVPGKWKGTENLESYREAIRAVVNRRQDENLYVLEGISLLPADLRYFADGLHPNDEGFAKLAQSLSKKYI